MHLRLSIILAVLCAAGCGHSTSGSMAVALPIERIHGWQTRAAELVLSRDPAGDLFLNVKVSTPRLGDGLTLATRVHQDLNDKGITNEIRCTLKPSGIGYDTQLHVSFPQGLPIHQETEAYQVLRPLLPVSPSPPPLVAERGAL